VIVSASRTWLACLILICNYLVLPGAASFLDPLAIHLPAARLPWAFTSGEKRKPIARASPPRLRRAYGRPEVCPKQECSGSALESEEVEKAERRVERPTPAIFGELRYGSTLSYGAEDGSR
jgi:hypothetical protein